MNLDSEAVLVLAAHGSGEQLSAGHDEPEHVVEGLEALPDGVLPLRARHHVRAVPHAAQQTLQPITTQYCRALTNHSSVLLIVTNHISVLLQYDQSQLSITL